MRKQGFGLLMLVMIVLSLASAVLAAEAVATDSGQSGGLVGWLLANWTWLLPWVLLLVDKIVTVTPTPYDDLILTAIKGALKSVGIKPDPPNLSSGKF